VPSGEAGGSGARSQGGARGGKYVRPKSARERTLGPRPRARAQDDGAGGRGRERRRSRGQRQPPGRGGNGTSGGRQADKPGRRRAPRPAGKSGRKAQRAQAGKGQRGPAIRPLARRRRAEGRSSGESTNREGARRARGGRQPPEDRQERKRRREGGGGKAARENPRGAGAPRRRARPESASTGPAHGGQVAGERQSGTLSAGRTAEAGSRLKGAGRGRA